MFPCKNTGLPLRGKVFAKLYLFLNPTDTFFARDHCPHFIKFLNEKDPKVFLRLPTWSVSGRIGWSSWFSGQKVAPNPATVAWFEATETIVYFNFTIFKINIEWWTTHVKSLCIVDARPKVRAWHIYLFSSKLRAGCNRWWRKTHWCEDVQVHLLVRYRHHENIMGVKFIRRLY